jgi:hypothetical protein
MLAGVDGERVERTARNADELHRRLVRQSGTDARDDMPSVEAVEHFDAYVSLLRRAPSSGRSVPASSSLMMVQLELGDGRWDVTEGDVRDVPSVGDTVRLADGRLSRLREIKTVLSGRSRKPPRKIAVCVVTA